ncbi:hypothetical protein PQJ75_08595 [Rhodoplanes sp. TEM]|uniref:Uncharacterized protein n=1 Tax=Rhodoplanes tepidamans TaxID=200616 RepID=A0ABT5J8V5_RHOTP|nr:MULTISPECIES: hypothetical protein [Rhodoplanes]MDC7786075.1 hypothetical protein [Rhodoplanes tepidamans]MDC7983784.1 hypothetical protein [Rhodoplanes sp. TEM]MDQ0354918.1 hypothetical protein [Rhodoplanes tepidamans]
MNDRPKDRPDGGKGVPAYEREAQALREKTERLRALRLARDGAEPPAATGRSGAKPKSGSASRSVAKSGSGSAKAPARSKAGKSTETLSEWLKTQEAQGRRS